MGRDVAIRRAQGKIGVQVKECGATEEIKRNLEYKKREGESEGERERGKEKE